MARTEMQKMLAGELYHPGAPDIQAAQAVTAVWLARYNAPVPRSPAVARALLAERLASVGEGVIVRAPFYCDYGSHIRIERGAFLNFGCIILDVAEVTIGERTQIGPVTQIYAADHPRDAAARREGLEFGRPVHVGNDVWIGGGAILLPGITVGDGAVIGAGSVVTHDVAEGAVVAGNPAHPIDRGPRP